MAVNRKSGRWSGKSARSGEAAGEAKAASDRKLQRQAEQARSKSQKKPKNDNYQATRRGKKGHWQAHGGF